MRFPCRFDVPRDLLDERFLRLEDGLVAQPFPELDHEPLAVEVAFVLEEVGLDPSLAAAVVWIRSDRDRGSVPTRRARVDPVLRASEVRLESEVCRRVSKGPAALIPRDDDSVQLERPAEHLGGSDHVALGKCRSDGGRRYAFDHWCYGDVEAEALEQREIARSSDSEPEVLAGHDQLGTYGSKKPLREQFRRQLLQVRCERRDENRLDARFREELEPAFERGQELDLVAERDPRVRIECDDRRLEARGLNRVEDGPMPPVDAVKAADRYRTAIRIELGREVCDPQSSLASAASGEMSRSGSASSTENGPISVRRSVRQWPPMASAMARTYVPEPT